MRSIGIHPYLIVSGLLFAIGIIGVFLNRRNLIALFMAVELILLAVNINFVTFSLYFKDMVGQVFSLFILTVAAAEAAIGLAILVSYFRQRSTINTDELHMLHEEIV
ncbi:MAG: NADH-quinone oxidoreductase subunit NuoK [Pseudomonadota bacterium]